jgi:hypothetical protein
MKIRTGFVSNSSSSSFICLGVRVSADDIIEALGDDKFSEILENEYGEVFYDSEGGNHVYFGAYETHSSDDGWDISPTNALKKFAKDESLHDIEKRLVKEVQELFLLPKSVKFEFGLFVGTVAS